MKKQNPVLVNLLLADDDVIATCAKHTGMDEMGNEWAPAFIYGDDTSAPVRNKVIGHLQKLGYTHANITDADYVFPVKSR